LIKSPLSATFIPICADAFSGRMEINMRVFLSKNPDGPFYDAAGNPAVLGTSTNLDNIGLKVMGNYKFSSLDTAYMACGHNSVLRDDDGKWYLFYHARFNNGTEYHEVRVHSMYFNEEG